MRAAVILLDGFGGERVKADGLQPPFPVVNDGYQRILFINVLQAP